MALWGMLAMGLGVMAWPGGAMAWTGQPLAYVTSNDGILVIDTGDDNVVDTIAGPALPTAVAPDGKHLYAFGNASDLVANISVIDTTDDKVVATVPLDVSLVGGVSLDQNSSAIAVTPDGKHVYVTTGLCPFPAFACHPEAVYFVLWEINTATNEVVAASVGKGIADGIAFTPDGQHIYLANFDPYYGFHQGFGLSHREPNFFTWECDYIARVFDSVRDSHHSGRETRLCPLCLL
jgi:YVTN family beta-propeller protein